MMLALRVREARAHESGCITGIKQHAEVLDADGNVLGELPITRVEYLMEPNQIGALKLTLLAEDARIECA